MIKKCPTCNRTYADETISFCLADGELLSAPYDSRSEPGANSDQSGPVTEILPAPVVPTQPAIAATQPAIQAERVSTITTAVPSPVRPTRADPTPNASNRKGWLVAGVLLLLTIVGGLVAYRMTNTTPSQTTASLPTNGSPELKVSAQSTPTPVAALAAPTVTPAPPPSSPVKNQALPTAATIDADPVLLPPDPRNLPNPTVGSGVGTGPGNGGGNTGNRQPSGPGGGAPYYDRVFSSKDVTQKARVLSKPQPQYTEEARKNQITGTVILQVVLAFDGQVTNIRPVSTLPDGLTEKAIAAARLLKFVPADKDGHAVSMYLQLEYNFNLY
jgi:TonB family protein